VYFISIFNQHWYGSNRSMLGLLIFSRRYLFLCLCIWNSHSRK